MNSALSVSRDFEFATRACSTPPVKRQAYRISYKRTQSCALPGCRPSGVLNQILGQIDRYLHGKKHFTDRLLCSISYLERQVHCNTVILSHSFFVSWAGTKWGCAASWRN